MWFEYAYGEKDYVTFIYFVAFEELVKIVMDSNFYILLFKYVLESYVPIILFFYGTLLNITTGI